MYIGVCSIIVLQQHFKHVIKEMLLGCRACNLMRVYERMKLTKSGNVLNYTIKINNFNLEKYSQTSHFNLYLYEFI